MNSSALLARAAVMVAAAAVSSASLAAIIQVRDAPGGEFANGYPGGPLLVGTGSQSFGQAGANAWGPKYVGTFDLQQNDGSGWTTFQSYCLQPAEPFAFGYNPDDLVGAPYVTASLSVDGINATEEVILEKLWANAFALSKTSQNNAAAFQWFVWELTEDNSFDLTSGNTSMAVVVPVVQTQKNIAQTWYNNIINGIWTSSVDLEALTNGNSQDFIHVVGVPAPGALALLGLAGLVGFRRRRQA